MTENEMKLTVIGKNDNEAFVRNAVCAFCTQLNPTVSEIEDVRTAVSEAYTNCVVHAYDGNETGTVEIEVKLQGKTAVIVIKDYGKGINDINQCMQPFFTTKPEQDRSGMGFTIMQSFMQEVTVTSEVDKGTTLIMRKTVED